MSAPPIPPHGDNFTSPYGPPIQPTPTPTPAPPIQPRLMEVTISVTEEVMRDLAKIGAEYTIHDGVVRNLSDVIVLLIEEHKQASSK